MSNSKPIDYKFLDIQNLKKILTQLIRQKNYQADARYHYTAITLKQIRQNPWCQYSPDIGIICHEIDS